MKRKICVATGSRAEYGLLRPLLDELKRDTVVRLQLLITGSHLMKEFGSTYKEIELDGFSIDNKVYISFESDTPAGVLKSMAVGMTRYAKVFETLAPDIVVVLGDRFEIFSLVTACHVLRIPVAHIHGGELTEGSLDDAFRHSITKMSHLHFTATEEYRKRVIQLGEAPETVFNVGAIGLDDIRKMKLLSREELERDLGVAFKRNNLLVTFHPETLNMNPAEGVNSLLRVLDDLQDTFTIFTKANADIEGMRVNRMIDNYVSQNTQRSAAFNSLGRLRYLSMMRLVDAVVGNSSSGIMEAPSFNIGTINIGDRQNGRIKADSVIDCKATEGGIRAAFKLLYSGSFRNSLPMVKNHYEGRHTSSDIKDILKSCNLNGILKKKFHDIRLK